SDNTEAPSVDQADARNGHPPCRGRRKDGTLARLAYYPLLHGCGSAGSHFFRANLIFNRSCSTVRPGTFSPSRSKSTNASLSVGPGGTIRNRAGFTASSGADCRPPSVTFRPPATNSTSMSSGGDFDSNLPTNRFNSASVSLTAAAADFGGVRFMSTF